MKKRQVFFFFLFCLTPFLPLPAQESIEESIRITTYYPSPYGSYQFLRSEIIQLKGTNGPPGRVFGKEEEGMLYYDKSEGLKYYNGREWASLGGSNSLLVGAEHTESDCNNAGGEVVATSATTNQCRFNRSSCPSGWTQYRDWSTTSQKTFSTRNFIKGACKIVSEKQWTGQYYRCNNGRSMCQSYYTVQTASVSGHAWANKARESCTYYYSGGGTLQYLYAGIEQVGCY